ncbi:MAG: MBL fold metallo-hydrolase [Spirochaetota bacterium]
MEIQWFGTATIKITEGNIALLFDPFISMNPHVQCTSIEDYKGTSDIFITHGHFDHILNIFDVWKSNKSTIYCSTQVADVLLHQGIVAQDIRIINHGQVVSIPPFIVKIYRGKHIRFDFPKIMKTLFSMRILQNLDNFLKILSLNKKMPMGNVFAYEIINQNKNILHFGSLNYSSDIEYPYAPSMLTLPLQGRDDIAMYAIEFVKKFMPHTLFLHHFDDTFPPLSSAVDATKFIEEITQLFPDILVILPQYGISYTV